MFENSSSFSESYCSLSMKCSFSNVPHLLFCVVYVYVEKQSWELRLLAYNGFCYKCVSQSIYYSYNTGMFFFNNVLILSNNCLWIPQFSNFSKRMFLHTLLNAWSWWNYCILSSVLYSNDLSLSCLIVNRESVQEVSLQKPNCGSIICLTHCAIIA